MADPFAKVVQGVADGTPLPVGLADGAGGEVPQPGNSLYSAVLINNTQITANYQSTSLASYLAKGVLVFADITALVGTSPSLSLSVTAVDPAESANFFDFIVASGLGVQSAHMMVYPGISESSGVRTSQALSNNFRIRVTVAGSPFTSANLYLSYILLY